MIKVTEIEELREKLGKANKKVFGLKDKVEQLKNKVLNAKINGMAEYKQSIKYRMSIGYAAVEFLAKEKIKMRRLMWRAYNTMNLSCLVDINTEPFSLNLGGEEKDEEMEQKVQQGELSKQSPPRHPSPKQSFPRQAPQA